MKGKGKSENEKWKRKGASGHPRLSYLSISQTSFIFVFSH